MPWRMTLGHGAFWLFSYFQGQLVLGFWYPEQASVKLAKFTLTRKSKVRTAHGQSQSWYSHWSEDRPGDKACHHRLWHHLWHVTSVSLVDSDPKAYAEAAGHTFSEEVYHGVHNAFRIVWGNWKWGLEDRKVSRSLGRRVPREIKLLKETWLLSIGLNCALYLHAITGCFFFDLCWFNIFSPRFPHNWKYDFNIEKLTVEYRALSFATN